MKLRPSDYLNVQIFPDGNQICVLYGPNLQEGVGGFGDDEESAKRDFDKNWSKELAKNSN